MAEQKGIFQQLGITGASEEQLLAQNVRDARAAREKRLAETPERFAGDRALSRAGSQLGDILNKKFGNPKLTPQQQASVQMQDQASKAVANRLAEDPAFAASVKDSPELMGIETMKEMGRAAFDAGNVVVGSQLTTEAARQQIEFRRSEKELRALDTTEDVARDKIQVSGNAVARRLGEVTSVIPLNSQGVYDLADLESQLVTGKFNVDSQRFEDEQGNEIPSFITLDEAISMKELAQDALTDSGAMTVAELSEDKRIRLFNSLIPASERTGLRANIDALRTQDQIMNRVADMFTEFTVEGRDPAQFLDGAGKVTAFSTGLASTVKAAGKTFLVNIASGTPEEIASGSGQVVASGLKDKRFNEAYADEIAAIELPPGMNSVGDAAAEYQSSIIQLAYAVARSNEPGARQLSDTDFRNALKEIGAAASDPERLRRVILANFSRKAEGLENRLQMVDEIGQSVALKPGQALDLVAGTRSRDNFMGKFTETQGRFTTLTEDLGELRESVALDEAGVAAGAAPIEETAAERRARFLAR